MLNFKALKSIIRKSALLSRDTETILLNQGAILAKLNEGKSFPRLSDAEFKIFSQWGEDGIIQHLIENIVITNRSFIEFGVETFEEANCRFLLINNNWSGFVIDGSESNIAAIRRDRNYWQRDLRATRAFITRDNICALLETSGFGREPGILSVDIDGNDYYVLQALHEYRPSIIIVEYNGLFGGDAAVTVPYDPAFVRTRKHHSNVYWGASLAAFDDLLSARDYALVGVNKVGSNAFFVRRDLMGGRLKAVNVSDVFGKVTFREARNEAGELLYLDNADSIALIAHLPLDDVRNGRQIKVGDLVPGQSS